MVTPYFSTSNGQAYHGDSLEILPQIISPDSVDLIVTSPPYALITKKEYGNPHSDDYLEWFKPFASVFYDILKPSGSLVINVGGSWTKGIPTRNLWVFELLLMLCKEFEFHLAQEYYWWNPSKIPNSEWVTVRRTRVKDAIEPIWWLSKTPWPKASNTRVLVPYSKWMINRIKSGGNFKTSDSPSGHDHRDKAVKDFGGSIPPNLIASHNSDSNSDYFRICKENGIQPHPARFPSIIPEYFMRMLTNKDDLVMDPFAGSCTSGVVAERLGRRWICIDTVESYLEGAKFKFNTPINGPNNKSIVPDPSILWENSGLDFILEDDIPHHGGNTTHL